MLSTKRAVLIHYNPDLVHCLDTGRVPGRLLVDIKKVPASSMILLPTNSNRSNLSLTEAVFLGSNKMTTVDHLAEIWGGRLCLWGLYALYCIFSIMRFIVKRYEQETDLLNTVFFKNHVPFARYLHSFHSSAIYTSHLLMYTWSWRFYRKQKNFRDIENPEVVTRHFSSNEMTGTLG